MRKLFHNGHISWGYASQLLNMWKHPSIQNDNDMMTKSYGRKKEFQKDSNVI